MSKTFLTVKLHCQSLGVIIHKLYGMLKEIRAVLLHTARKEMHQYTNFWPDRMATPVIQMIGVELL